MRDCLQNPENAPRNRTPQLQDAKVHPVTVFTRQYGPLPAYTTSLRCPACATTYKHDYYIHSNATLRTYYPLENSPVFVQSSKHVFLEWALGEWFDNQMAFAWYVTLMLSI